MRVLRVDPAVRGSLNELLSNKIWREMFDRDCEAGAQAIHRRASRYLAALVALGLPAECSKDVVADALLTLAMRDNPDSLAGIEAVSGDTPAATQSLTAGSPPVAEPAVGEESEDPAWDEVWALGEIARAIIYIEGRTASGDDPDAATEWREVLEAKDEHDEERFRAALHAAVRASIRELCSEGRLLPEPDIEPTPSGDKRKSLWGARISYRDQRIQR